MKPFIERKACTSRKHCVTCRAQTEAGAKWRAAAGAPEICPFGVGIERKVVEPEPITLTKLAHGAVATAKAVVRIDRPSDNVIAARLAICESCEHATTLAGAVRGCAICRCAFWGKVRNAKEKCPLDPPKWDVV